MSLRIRQIVFAARDLAKTIDQFQNALGIQVCYRDPNVGEFGLENALFTIGDQFLEIVSPVKDNTAAGRHLDRHGDSAYMLIFQTDDLDKDRARLKTLGVRLVWESSYPDICSVHLHPKDIGAAIVSIDQATPPESWRWAGPDWQKFASNNGAQKVLEATIGARDPNAMAKRWSEVLGTGRPLANRIGINEGALNFSKAGADIITEYRIVTNQTHVKASALTICGTK